jgi:hypothetical protein
LTCRQNVVATMNDIVATINGVHCLYMPKEYVYTLYKAVEVALHPPLNELSQPTHNPIA